MLQLQHVYGFVACTFTSIESDESEQQRVMRDRRLFIVASIGWAFVGAQQLGFIGGCWAGRAGHMQVCIVDRL